MTKLKTLNEEKFTKLYKALPVVILAEELEVDEKPIMKRAVKFGLNGTKIIGRPHQKMYFKGEEPKFKYEDEINDILIEALLSDKVSTERLLEKGYPLEYIMEKRKQYGYLEQTEQS